MNKVKRFYKFPNTVYFDDFKIQSDYLSETNQLVNVFPSINVLNQGNEIEVQVLVPVVNQSSIGVTVRDYDVVISSAGVGNNSDKDYYVREFAIPQFIRSVNLPCAVNKETVKQEMRNGVLVINLKKL